MKKTYNKSRPKEKHSAFCWAPFTSLRFHRNGFVQVCCHHIDYYSLSERTLKEIWFGTELQQMRKKMKQYDIPSSCNFCKSNYLNGNFSNVNALAFDHYPPNKSRYPAFMDFSLENTCNLACVMCDAGLSSTIQRNKNIGQKERSFVYDEKFIKQLDEFIPHLKGAVFTGGEPFLIESNYKIWNNIVRINPQMDLYITTNATIWNDKIKETLDKGRFNITASVDSFTKSSYEQIRLGASFEKTMENIMKFADYCKLEGTQFSIAVCPMQINAFEIPDIVKNCNYNGWGFSYNTLMKPWNLAIWSMAEYEIKKLLEYYQKTNFDTSENETKKKNINRYNALIELIELWCIKMKSIHEEDPVRQKNLIENKLMAKEILLALLTNKTETNLVNRKMDIVLEKLPLMFFTEDFLIYLKQLANPLIINEFIEKDENTISDHLTILAFQFLLMA
ncbi:MAG TPA: twitch domain-containing radical SAM protein [Bacteroidales bacterium]|nr:twitch domain-containing radical SAM protein [Bacteroidales bacterium]